MLGQVSTWSVMLYQVTACLFRFGQVMSGEVR